MEETRTTTERKEKKIKEEKEKTNYGLRERKGNMQVLWKKGGELFTTS